MPQSIALAQALPLLGAIVAFLFAALLVLYIFRLLFGQKIRAPGPRKGQRRLDVIDTFELGRDRQLVVVRRDNVEHLILIGGPNDVLVEGSIPRMEGREQRPAPAREKEGAAADWPAPPASGPTPQPTPAPQAPGRTAPPAEPPRRRPVEAAASETAPNLGQQPSPGTSLPPDLFAPSSPQRPVAPAAAEAPPPRPASPGLTPRPAAPQPPPPRVSAPPFLARTQRVVGPPSPRKDVPNSPAPKENSLPPREAPPAQKSANAQTPDTSSDPLDTLEAEMARLLGRPDPGP